MNFANRGILTALALVALRASTNAYAPLGHEIVGAIADERLANTPTAAKVYSLLEGLTLEKPLSLQMRSKAGTAREWTTRALSITRRIATLTGNCAIFGAQISRHTIPILPPLRTIGFTTPTFR
jgi:hypothetical protein